MSKLRQRLTCGSVTWIVAAFLCLWAAPAALATDSVYWANFGNSTISFAGLDGSGGGQLPTTGATPSNPVGVAIDPAAGKIYWANAGNNTISFARLDGSGGGQLTTNGATPSGPEGVAIDPAAGKIYWANFANSTISFAGLDGSGGGQLPTTGATPSGPVGVAIDLAAGRIYWANTSNNTISFARLDGSGGGGQLPTSGATLSGPSGVAIDPVAGKIYWANELSDTISFANLDGSGGGQLPTSGATLSFPSGVAIDPAAGKIYWANDGSGTISFARLDGSGGGGQLPAAGATAISPNFPALLKAPSGAAVPAISGGSAPGAVLSCSQGGWAADLLGSFLYRAPQTFAYQWSRNGQPIGGATGSFLVATEPGSYACEVTATNAAGSAAQASAPLTVSIPATLKITKVKRNKRKGTATIFAQVSGPGNLTLTGRGLLKQTGSSHGVGVVKLAVKGKGKAKRKLNKRGRVKVKVTVTFTPTSGEPASQSKTLKLIKRR